MKEAVAKQDATTVIRLVRWNTDLSHLALVKMTSLAQSTISDVVSGKLVLKKVDKITAALEGLGAITSPNAPQSSGADPAALTVTVSSEPNQHRGNPTNAYPATPSLKELLVTSVDDYTLAGLEQRLTALATAYVSTPPSPLLPRVRKLRASALGHYQAGVRPHQAHDLLVMVGICDLLLAHAAHDSGDPATALTRLEDADRCAGYTAHTHLSSWITGTRALIADWHPTTGASLTPSRQVPHSPQSWARLTAIQARAAARRNDTFAARTALERLLEHPSQALEDPEELSVRVGGILSFPAPKRDYYIAATLVLLGDGEQALHHSNRAITTYETGPTIHRSYGDLALARTDQVKAHLLRGDVPSALATLEQVAHTPTPARIHQLRPALASCARLAQRAPITSREAKEVTEAVTTLRLP